MGAGFFEQVGQVFRLPRWAAGVLQGDGAWAGVSAGLQQGEQGEGAGGNQRERGVVDVQGVGAVDFVVQALPVGGDAADDAAHRAAQPQRCAEGERV